MQNDESEQMSGSPEEQSSPEPEELEDPMDQHSYAEEDEHELTYDVRMEAYFAVMGEYGNNVCVYDCSSILLKN